MLLGIADRGNGSHECRLGPESPATSMQNSPWAPGIAPPPTWSIGEHDAPRHHRVTGTLPVIYRADCIFVPCNMGLGADRHSGRRPNFIWRASTSGDSPCKSSDWGQFLFSARGVLTRLDCWTKPVSRFWLECGHVGTSSSRSGSTAWSNRGGGKPFSLGSGQVCDLPLGRPARRQTDPGTTPHWSTGGFKLITSDAHRSPPAAPNRWPRHIHSERRRPPRARAGRATLHEDGTI